MEQFHSPKAVLVITAGTLLLLLTPVVVGVIVHLSHRPTIDTRTPFQKFQAIPTGGLIQRWSENSPGQLTGIVTSSWTVLTPKAQETALVGFIRQWQNLNPPESRTQMTVKLYNRSGTRVVAETTPRLVRIFR